MLRGPLGFIREDVEAEDEHMVDVTNIPSPSQVKEESRGRASEHTRQSISVKIKREAGEQQFEASDRRMSHLDTPENTARPLLGWAGETEGSRVQRGAARERGGDVCSSLWGMWLDDKVSFTNRFITVGNTERWTHMLQSARAGVRRRMLSPCERQFFTAAPLNPSIALDLTVVAYVAVCLRELIVWTKRVSNESGPSHNSVRSWNGACTPKSLYTKTSMFVCRPPVQRAVTIALTWVSLCV